MPGYGKFQLPSAVEAMHCLISKFKVIKTNLKKTYSGVLYILLLYISLLVIEKRCDKLSPLLSYVDSLFCPQKLFGIEMAEFKVQIKCMWNSETGEFENFAGEEEPMQDNEDDDDNEDGQ